MPEGTRDSRSVVQGALRRKRGLTVGQLAEKCGDSPAVISQNERMDGTPPALRKLKERAESMGFAPTLAELAVVVFDLGDLEPPEPTTPLDPTPEEELAIQEQALRFGLRAYELAASALKERRYRRRVARQRAQAVKRAERLLAYPSPRWRLLVAGGPRYQTWALVERLCELSRAAASDKVQRALRLADLALYAAGFVIGPAVWRDRLRGFAWAFVGNARRVASDHDGADAAFRTAWELWRKGYEERLPLADWRLPDLEASLRRDERRWPEALDLHERALATAPEEARGAILLKQAYAFDQMGEPERALQTLGQAEPLVERGGDPRLRFGLRFNLVNALITLGRLDEAEARLPEVWRRARALNNELDLVRTVWLQARLDAARGRVAQALAALEQVMRDFRDREIAYDSALAGLDAALLYLETGAAPQAERLAGELVWVFTAQRVSREALAALRLFCDAAEENRLTLDIARKAVADFRKAGSSPASLCPE